MSTKRIDETVKFAAAAALLIGSALGAAGCGADETEANGDGVSAVVSALSASSAADRATLALRWAPVHGQDVDQTGSQGLGGAADYITNVDYPYQGIGG